jgi:RNA polymerase sigma factor (sigma-70 family)
MTTTFVSSLQALRRAALLPTGASLSDERLLELFIDDNDEVAFEMLLRRHGPMVYDVCRRVLRNLTDAEDAVQATYLVLVRKAGTIAPRSMVGNWLHGVAYRTALKARAAVQKRQKRERQVPAFAEPEAPPEDTRLRDLQCLLDRELGRLSEKYRVPIILCDLERKSHKEAARQLGWPEGTLSVRLMRGREMLAKRLTRCGLSLSAASLVVLLSENAVSARMPGAIVSATVKAAGCITVGKAASAGLISAKVVDLMKGVLRAMLITKFKTAAVVSVLGAAILMGGGLTAYHFAVGKELAFAPNDAIAVEVHQDPPQQQAVTRPVEVPPNGPETSPQIGAAKLRGTWRVVSRESASHQTAPKEEKWIIGKESIVMSQGLIGIGKPPTGRQEATYRLWGDNDDPGPVPNGINLTLSVVVDKSPDTEKTSEQQMTWRGIFGWDGDRLVLCFWQKPTLGLPRRPTVIPITPIKEDGLLVLVLERIENATPTTDEEKLQGDWQMIDSVTNGEKIEGENIAVLDWLMGAKFTFDGNNVTIPMTERPLQFRLDTSKSPKQISMRFQGNFLVTKDQRTEIELQGIYSLDGDDLKICLVGPKGFSKESDGTLPGDFVSKKGSGRILFILKRQKPEKEATPAKVQFELGSAHQQNDKTANRKPRKVGAILTVGNDKVPFEVISRKIRLESGQVFDDESLRLAEKTLAAFPLFVVDPEKGIRPTVTAIAPQANSEFWDILVTVKEK